MEKERFLKLEIGTDPAIEESITCIEEQNEGIRCAEHPPIELTSDGRTRDQIRVINGKCEFELKANSKISKYTRLETVKFPLFWKKDCVAPSSCPKAAALRGSYYCKEMTRATEDNTCEWDCEGEINFPTDVQFRYDDLGNSAPDQVWESTVRYPGQTIHDYIAGDQRSLEIVWEDFGCRKKVYKNRKKCKKEKCDPDLWINGHCTAENCKRKFSDYRKCGKMQKG